MFITVNEFNDWLQEQLDSRGINRSQLAVKGGFAKSNLSMIASGERQPGAEICREIARVLDLPEELVFRKAGLLSPTWDQLTDDDIPNVAEWRSVLLSLTHENRHELLEIARLKLERQRDQVFTERFKSLPHDQQAEAWQLIEELMRRKGWIRKE